MAGNVTGNFTGKVSTCRRNVDGRGESRDGGGLDPSVLSGSTYRLVETLASPTLAHEPGEVGLCHGVRGIGVQFRKKAALALDLGTFPRRYRSNVATIEAGRSIVSPGAWVRGWSE